MALVARTVDELGRVDVVVNNAGGSHLFALEDTPLEKWDNSFALNVRVPFVLTQAAGRHMEWGTRGIRANCIAVGAGG